MGDRKSIPRGTRREVLLEFELRCALPGCRYPDVDVHHIIEVEDGGTDEYENLIALCPNHHRDLHRGRGDRQMLRRLKANASFVAGRYGDAERRLLRMFIEDPSRGSLVLDQSAEFHFAYLIADGHVVLSRAGSGMVTGPFTVTPDPAGGRPFVTGGHFTGPMLVSLTESGRALVESLRAVGEGNDA